MANRGPLFLFTLLLLMFGIAETAEARRRGVVIINYGDDFYELGTAQAPSPESGLELSAADLKVGYHCQMLGLCWLNILTWGGEYCLYRKVGGETEYEPLTPDMAAAFLNKPLSRLEKPWTYSYPPGMFVYGGLILIGFLRMKGAAGSKGNMAGGMNRNPTTSPERPRWTPPPPQQTAPPPVLSGRVMAPALPAAFASLPPPLPPPLPPEDGSPLLPVALPMVAGPVLPAVPPILPPPVAANFALPPLSPCPAPPLIPAPAVQPPATPGNPPSAAQPRVTPPAAKSETVQKRYGGPPSKPSPPAESGKRDDETEMMLFVPWSKVPASTGS